MNFLNDDEFHFSSIVIDDKTPLPNSRSLRNGNNLIISFCGQISLRGRTIWEKIMSHFYLHGISYIFLKYLQYFTDCDVFIINKIINKFNISNLVNFILLLGKTHFL